MSRQILKIQVLAAVAAVAIVTGAIAGLSNYSNAKYEAALAEAQGPASAPFVQLALEPLRVEVVASRSPRTRTAETAVADRPQS